MSILAMIGIGLLVGIIAKFLMPGNDPGGFIVTTLIGIAGAFLAGYAAAPSAGMPMANPPAFSPPWSAPSCC